jgi:2-hydroxychromene-2-carboxylate isomerase
MTIVVYGDFGCLPCYLASRRVDALAAAGADVEWRAVEQRPGTLVAGRPLDDADRRALEAQAATIEPDLLAGEKLLWAPPRLAPRTDAAISAYAEACGAGVGRDVRGLLFAAYWIGGADLGNPEVLRNLLIGPVLRGHSAVHALREAGYCVSANRGPISTAAWRRVRAWRGEWQQLGQPELPVLADGQQTLTGVAALRRLGAEISRAPRSVPPDDLDPARYPLAPDAPLGWVSEVGGPWKYAVRVAMPASKTSSATRQLLGPPAPPAAQTAASSTLVGNRS